MKIYVKALFTVRREHNYLASRNITVRVSPGYLHNKLKNNFLKI